VVGEEGRQTSHQISKQRAVLRLSTNISRSKIDFTLKFKFKFKFEIEAICGTMGLSSDIAKVYLIDFLKASLLKTASFLRYNSNTAAGWAKKALHEYAEPACVEPVWCQETATNRGFKSVKLPPCVSESGK
jgi:hypothetical protein